LLLAFVNSHRLITSLYLVLFAGLGITAGFLFLEARGEYNRLKKIEAVNRRVLAEAEAKLREQEIILERLRNDPAYVERVIKRRLGYVRPGPEQFIFHFKE
jgi:cell division protein DivIC